MISFFGDALQVWIFKKSYSLVCFSKLLEMGGSTSYRKIPKLNYSVLYNYIDENLTLSHF